MREVIIVLLIVDVLIILLGLPLAFGWVKRNSHYGLRTKRTLADPTIWDQANRFAGRALILAAGLHSVFCILQLSSVIQLSPSLTAAALTAGVGAAGALAFHRAGGATGGETVGRH